MEKVLTGLELSVAVRELLNKLAGARVNKIYQPNSKTLLLGLRKDAKAIAKIDSGVGVYLTSYDYKTQEVPPSFCMFLRKYLMNSSLADIKQKGLERIIEFKFDTKDGARVLICELFGNGNFILCEDDYKILNLAVNKVFKDRTLKKGEKYKYPPEKFNVLKLNQKFFLGALESWKDNKVVKMIASGLGLGGTYAEEVCLRVDIDKNKICSQINKEDATNLYRGIKDLVLEFDKSKTGFIFLEDKTLVDASPLKLKLYSNLETKQVTSFNEAIDILFASSEGRKVRNEKSVIFEKKLESLKQRLDIQKNSLEEYKENWKENQRVADEIYDKYQLVSKILEKISTAKTMGYSLDEIKSVLEQERSRGIQEATLVKDVLQEENKILVYIEGGIKLDLNKSISKNAEVYYDKAKESKAKITGAENIITQTEKEIQNLLEKKETAEVEISKSMPKTVEVIKKEWYEKFHWFYTSGGLLAIGGRDSTQNEIIIKKYMEISDLVFHTEMAGSPFFLLKEGKDKKTKEDLEEVAIATASFSKAWSSNVSSENVYWVKPEQVTKESKAGEYLSKGSFMVYGRKNFLKNTALQLSIGIDKEGKVFAGPRTAVTKNAVKYVSVSQGSEKKSDIAKKISHQLGTKDLDGVMRSLPAGTFALAP